MTVVAAICTGRYQYNIGGYTEIIALCPVEIAGNVKVDSSHKKAPAENQHYENPLTPMQDTVKGRS